VRDRREGQGSRNADYQVTPDDIKAWTDANGPIPDGACVAMNSGWAAHVGTDKFRGADADKKMHFPGFHIEATKALLETGAVGMAVDTLSLDYGPSGDFATHYAWLPTNRWGLECIAQPRRRAGQGCHAHPGCTEAPGRHRRPRPRAGNDVSRLPFTPLVTLGLVPRVHVSPAQGRG
jgi:hypothetical protein